MPTLVDLRPTIIPKSDQLNSDDLIAGPITVAVTKVLLSGVAEQPVSIHYEGDDGKPYKICKSMRRVLVHCWGPDASIYAGRKMTLYRDPNVRFGGVAVGGIRISHLSHIDRPITMALTESRANRKPYTVQPLAASSPGGERPAGGPDSSPPAEPAFDEIAVYRELFIALETAGERLLDVWAENRPRLALLRKADPVAYADLVEQKDRLKTIAQEAHADE